VPFHARWPVRTASERRTHRPVGRRRSALRAPDGRKSESEIAMTRPKYAIPEGMELCPMPPKVAPSKGIGRPRGALNRQTVMIKDAITCVYRDLQESAGGDNRHFLAWAKENPGDFYRMCLRLLPLQVEAKMDGPKIGRVVFVRDYV
jgi:hypothetical protein